MSRTMLTTVLAALVAVSFTMLGEEPKKDDMARVDISSKDVMQSIKAVTTKLVHANAGWLKDSNPDSYHYFQMKVTDDWQPMEFTIIPEADGAYVLNLKGEYRPKEKDSKELTPVEILYDLVDMNGDYAMINGSFEKLDKNGLPEGWTSQPAFAKEGRVVQDAKLAKDG